MRHVKTVTGGINGEVIPTPFATNGNFFDEVVRGGMIREGKGEKEREQQSEFRFHKESI